MQNIIISIHNDCCTINPLLLAFDHRSIYRVFNTVDFASQYWVIESVDFYNIARLASDPTFCLTIDFTQYDPTGDLAVIRQCVESEFTYQRFAFMQTSWNDVRFVWQKHNSYSLTRSATAISANKYALQLSASGINDGKDQVFKVEFIENINGRKSSINTMCTYDSFLKTMDTKGNAVGQTERLSVQDILQLQLLYQCPSGPRSISNFCSDDCKCKLNQGACSSDTHCQQGLACKSDGAAIKNVLQVYQCPAHIPRRSNVLKIVFVFGPRLEIKKNVLNLHAISLQARSYARRSQSDVVGILLQDLVIANNKAFIKF